MNKCAILQTTKKTHVGGINFQDKRKMRKLKAIANLKGTEKKIKL